MITYLIGKLVEKNSSRLIIDCHGIGYHICISSHTYSFLLKQNVGEKIHIYTYLLIKESQYVLYGFFEKIERKIFSYLISVNGIGPSLAIMLLSSLTPHEIQESIYKGNVEPLNNVKGIGKKIAKRIIIELKDKISKEFTGKENPFKREIPHYHKKKEALRALHVLGFSSKNSEGILEDLLEKHPSYSVEHVVKEFLKKL
ncbi:Holliday junction branch migration protein RuvA [Blattabacterium cuenoti]|uniref:Holliday junction branch migration protein RuvA n=1 Tax=Blattabacterium cuenoti TaxID=1653831 RepID=UPI00163BAE57|nr:Holliday junction branch migration protein RuvA [Blattabacterium cuenoti]